MGCSQLWSVLGNRGVVHGVKGGEARGQERIARELDGKYVAVDLSLWIMQAITHGELKKTFKEDERILKVVFERIVNCLRFGCIAIIVKEGEQDPAKRQLIEQRYNLRNNGGGGGSRPNYKFNSQSDLVAEMVEALGLTTVQAAGEGEGTCAALNSCGLVDACVTSDMDALLFGALTVYKSFSLSTVRPQDCELSSCQIQDIQKLLGIAQGGHLALQLITMLSGGDYNIGGALNVGPARALKVAQCLLKKEKDDSRIFEKFWAGVSGPEDPEMEKLALNGKCTGCSNCGCEGGKLNKVKMHGKLGCYGCGTQSKEKGGNGEGGCMERAFSDCQCRFHATELERVTFKVMREVRNQFDRCESFQNAISTYRRQSRAACQAIRHLSKNELGWKHRPDLDRLARSLGDRLHWGPCTLREKLMPILLEWDIAHSKIGAFEVSGIDVPEFEPVAIKKISGMGAKQENRPWRYLMEFRRRSTPNGEDAEVDQEWLRNSAQAEKRTVRMTLIQKWHPDIVETHTARLEEAEAKKAGRLTGGRKKYPYQKNKLTRYFATSPRMAPEPAENRAFAEELAPAGPSFNSTIDEGVECEETDVPPVRHGGTEDDPMKNAPKQGSTLFDRVSKRVPQQGSQFVSMSHSPSRSSDSTHFNIQGSTVSYDRPVPPAVIHHQTVPEPSTPWHKPDGQGIVSLLTTDQESAARPSTRPSLNISPLTSTSFTNQGQIEVVFTPSSTRSTRSSLGNVPHGSFEHSQKWAGHQSVAGNGLNGEGGGLGGPRKLVFDERDSGLGSIATGSCQTGLDNAHRDQYQVIIIQGVRKEVKRM